MYIQNRYYKVIKEYKRFYLANNGYYNECFFKDEYTPTKAGYIIKQIKYIRVVNNML